MESLKAGGEISQDIGEISSPEGVDSLCLEDPGGAVDDTSVGLVQAALLDHLVLVLHQQLNPLDRGSGGLGDAGSHSGEHEALEKSQFLVSHCGVLLHSENRSHRGEAAKA